MKNLLLTKARKDIVDKIFIHETPFGDNYSIYFTDSDATVWCSTISEIYLVIYEHLKETNQRG